MRLKSIMICLVRPVSVPKYQNQSKHTSLNISFLVESHTLVIGESFCELRLEFERNLTQHFVVFAAAVNFFIDKMAHRNEEIYTQ